jgi:hypothetical protein
VRPRGGGAEERGNGSARVLGGGGVRAQVGGAAGPLKDGSRGLGVRAQRGKSPADSEAVERRRKQRKGRERRGKELTRGATESEGERKGGESRRALGLGEKKRRWAGLAHAGRRKGGESWASVALGRGKKKRERGPAGEGEKGEGTWAGPRRGFGLPTFILSLLLFFFFTQSIQTNYLNSKYNLNSNT